ncbi:hypothetical protein GDO81_013640 [Engystomops pustulosus]|uniref:Uncharacterized protein n=1 Tax=Engystomops pustulosus TaxID=76066 RepID=A0AAV7B4V4_ENGPU|nr:hypothetical protein GDO81_013640 [Engystomops pustulosus]
MNPRCKEEGNTTESDRMYQQILPIHLILISLSTFFKHISVIKNIFSQHWNILLHYPHLSHILPKNLRFTFRQNHTLRNTLAPSCLKNVENSNKRAQISFFPALKGVFKCRNSLCKCCLSIAHRKI